MPWYEEFFDEDYMRFHLRGGATQAERALSECDFVVKALELKPGDRILDLCCGQGRHSIELAKRGFQVTGADLSEYLLGLAQEAAQEAGVDVRFHCCDMRDLPWEGEFHAVINMWTSFGYLESEEEDEKVLRAARKALRPGGELLLDVVNRERIEAHFLSKDWYEHQGHFVLDERSWDEERKRQITKRIIVKSDGTRRIQDYDLRLYTHMELCEMLDRAGLETQRTHGDFDLSEFGPQSRRMLVVARGPA